MVKLEWELALVHPSRKGSEGSTLLDQKLILKSIEELQSLPSCIELFQIQHSAIVEDA